MSRSAFTSAGCAAAALLWAAPAQALSSETICENIKLHAAGRYAGCVARAAQHANSAGSEIDEAAIQRCNERFDRAFEWAEASGGCRTAGGPSPLRSPILGQMTDTLTTTTAGPGCPQAPVLNGQQWSCTLTSGTSVDLASIVAQINAEGVTLESPIWIEAWGGNGAAGDHGGNGGSGGSGGYAQTTTSVADVLAAFGSTDIYYYNGAIGTGASDSGGQGGSASLVTSVDLTQTAPDPDQNVFAIAGGGGGGGSGSTGGNCGYSGHSDIDVYGGGGGSGGEAIADIDGNGLRAGSQGGGRRDRNVSGDGGATHNDPNGGASGGGKATDGDSGVAALGGPRGEFEQRVGTERLRQHLGCRAHLEGWRRGRNRRGQRSRRRRRRRLWRRRRRRRRGRQHTLRLGRWRRRRQLGPGLDGDLSPQRADQSEFRHRRRADRLSDRGLRELRPG